MIKRCFLSRNSVCLLIGVILILISVLEIKLHLINYDLCFKIIAILGAILFIKGVYDLRQDSLKKDVQYPYGFDYINEFEKYKNIGKTSNGDENESHIINRNMKDHNMQSIRQAFGNYCEWKKYILDKYQSRINDENFYRYVIRLLRGKEYYVELTTLVAVPVEIAILSSICAIRFVIERVPVLIPVVFIIVLAFISKDFYHWKLECNFLNDFNEIVFPKFSTTNSTLYK